MAMSEFNVGDKVRTNPLLGVSTRYPVGVTGIVSDKATDFMLFFTPDVAVDGFGDEDGQWAVTSDEVDKLEV